MKFKKITLAIIIVFMMTGCSSLILTNIRPADVYVPIPESTKTLYIPKYGEEHQFKAYPYTYWNFCKQKENQLELVSPEIADNSFIFRFWITNPSGKTNQPHGLIEIKKDSSNYSGKLILMHVDFKLSNLSETITDHIVIDLKPLKSDWQTTIDSLLILKINELPTDDLIPGYYEYGAGYGSNSPTYSFEYADKKHYRFYQYSDVFRTSDKFWQAENIKLILSLLNDEFQWDKQGRDYFKD